MRKSLLLVNICCAFIFASCRDNQSKVESESAEVVDTIGERKPAVNEPPLAVDTQKTGAVAPVSGTVGTSVAVEKDTLKKVKEAKAIMHPAPDQAMIDSIKKAKTKGKK